MSTTGSCNEVVFEQLFKRIAPLLRNFLYAKYNNLERANDMVQEAFITLWKNCSKVLPDMAKAYVFRVAQNQMLKLVSKDQTKEKHIQFIYRDRHHESPEFQMEFNEFDQKVQQAINALTEAQREVFLMNRIEQLTYAEIANLLQISQKAVEKRMHKALKTLREKIGEI